MKKVNSALLGGQAKLKVKSFIENLILDIRYSLRSKAGFTLVELMIYMGMLSILVTVLTMVFIQIVNAQLEVQATSTTEQDSRYILSRLAYDISRAQSISSPALGASAANTLQLVIGGVTYTYNVNGSSAMVVTSNGVTNALNSYDTSVSALSFQQLGQSGGKNSVKISYTLTSKIIKQSGQETRTIQSTIGTR